MNQLALRLKNLKESGIYNINCDVNDVRSAAREAGLVLFDMDFGAVHSKSEFMAAIAQSIAAPEWFGKNWDALADALADLSWKEAPGYVMLMVNCNANFNLLANDHDVAKEILESTVKHWNLQGKPFWIFHC
ncbi:MAG: barstar family protein [Gallionellaceae bacterium]|jgi:RNAse (barnase) inhibitor barstar